MKYFEITCRNGKPLPYLVRINGENNFETYKFVDAALSVNIGLLKAHYEGEAVKVFYCGKISKKDKLRIDNLVDELWPAK